MQEKPRRGERLSEYYNRIKPHERKVGEAAANLAKCFSDESKLRVTQSAAGNERIRAFIPDEDGYAGWLENAYYAGVAFVNHNGERKYLAEQHFPHQRSKPTYFWEFSLDTGSITFIRTEGTEATPTLDLPITADEDHESYFLRLTKDLAHAYRFNDYENKLPGEQYDFVLDELR